MVMATTGKGASIARMSAHTPAMSTPAGMILARP